MYSRRMRGIWSTRFKTNLTGNKENNPFAKANQSPVVNHDIPRRD